MDCRDHHVGLNAFVRGLTQAGQITATWSVATKRKGRPLAAFHKHN